METKVELPPGFRPFETGQAIYVGQDWYNAGDVKQYGNRRAEEARQQERSTRRDELATEALRLLLPVFVRDAIDRTYDDIAKSAYALADAMLAARDDS